MTNAYASMHGRSLASTFDAGVTGIVGRLRNALTKHRTYRKTLAELRALSIDSRLDLEFHRGDLAMIARRAVYGH
jgi:hypothetical protein